MADLKQPAMRPAVVEVNVYVDGVCKHTASDSIAARYMGQHLYSEIVRAGGAPPEITYTTRTVQGEAVEEVPLV
jgi:hypothetical protein